MCISVAVRIYVRFLSEITVIYIADNSREVSSFIKHFFLIFL